MTISRNPSSNPSGASAYVPSAVAITGGSISGTSIASSNVAITGGVIGGRSVQAVGSLAGVLPQFAQSALSQQVNALASARASYEDSAALAVDERWASLASWVTPGTPGVQVNGGALYAASAGAGTGSGANRSYALAASENLRAVFTVNYISGGSLVIGVSSDAAGATPTASAGAAFGLFFSGTQAQQCSFGTMTNVAPDVAGNAQPALSTGQYIVTVTVDQTYISVVAYRANGDEIRVRRLRAGFNVNNLYVFNGDSRGLSGASIGPVGARKAVASVLPLATYEAVTQRIHWSGDGINDFKLWLPTTYDSRKPLPLIIAFHPRGSSENFLTSNLSTKTAILNAGYAVLTCTYSANRTTWGAQASLDAYTAAYNWARSLYPIGPVGIFATSMGGIESLLFLAERRVPGIAAWVGVSATTNLADNYANGFAGDINAAYSISGGNYATQTAGHDPMLLDASSFRGIPLYFLTATDDATVSKANNTDAFVSKAGSYNPVTVEPGITGGHTFTVDPYLSKITTFYASALNL